MKKQSRSDARRAAFTQIFMLSQQHDDMEQMYSAMLEEIPECKDNIDYIKTVVEGVDKTKPELDEIISSHLKSGWSLRRISKASHSILLLALYEIKYVDDVPEKVAINEAVRLANEYCDKSDVKFINGLLGAVIKEQ